MKNPVLFLLVFATILFQSCSKDLNSEETEPDVIAPTISFSIAGFTNNSSTEPIVVSNQIEININAQDSQGIAKIEAFINDEKVGEDTNAPYSIIVDVSNLTSKTGKTSIFENYTLKITATDTSGNSESVEQLINVDNEKPTISAVTLAEGSIINGDTNPVLFEVSDNEELISITAYLNDELLVDIPLDDLSININSNNLTDGQNLLKLEAKDSGNNTGIYEVNFISDNTGPEITLEAIPEDQIIDESLSFAPVVSDVYSELATVELIYGETSLQIFEGTEDPNVEFDPNQYPTGSDTLIIKAKDELGNESEMIYTLEIYRRLITINFPPDYFDPQLARIHVFASDMAGKLLDDQRVLSTTDQIILRTQAERAFDDEFMLTFGQYSTGAFGNSSLFTTLQNISTTTIDAINLITVPRFEYGPTDPTRIPAPGFDTQDLIGMNIEGFGYGGSFYRETDEVAFDRRRNTTSDVNTNLIYIPQVNLTLNEYSYFVTDWDIPSDFVISPDLFSEENIEKRFYQPMLSGGSSFESSSYWIAGYFSEEDFQNNVYHRIDGHGYGFQASEGIPYYFNTIFDKYRYHIRINDYFTERTGEIPASISALDWTIDYTFDNNEIDINKTGTGHSVGKVFLDNDPFEVINGLNIDYSWNIVFDSQKMDKIIIPEIPEEIQTWGFYDIYEQNNLELAQIEIKRYDNIASYNEYLQKVIKDNRPSYLVSPVMESIFKSDLNGVYNRQRNFLVY